MLSCAASPHHVTLCVIYSCASRSHGSFAICQGKTQMFSQSPKHVYAGCRPTNGFRYHPYQHHNTCWENCCHTHMHSAAGAGLQYCPSCLPPNFFLSKKSSRISNSKICSNSRACLVADNRLRMFRCVFIHSLWLCMLQIAMMPSLNMGVCCIMPQ